MNDLKTNDYYKSCMTCREDDKQFKIKSRDESNAKKREHYKQVKENRAEQIKRWQRTIKTY